MGTRADYYVLPGVAPRLRARINEIREAFKEEHHRTISDSEIAKRIGLTAETLRRLQYLDNPELNITVEPVTDGTAIRLVQLDISLVEFIEISKDAVFKSTNALVTAAIAALLPEDQGEYISKSVRFLKEHPDIKPNGFDFGLSAGPG